MTMRTFKVNVIYPGTGARFEYIEGVNPNEVRMMAESRFGGARIGSINQVNSR